MAIVISGTLNDITVDGSSVVTEAEAATQLLHTTGNETKAGVLTFTSSPIAPTPTVGDNSTKVATTAFIKTEVDNAVDVLKGVPQNAQTAAYTLALTDRGKSIDVNTGGITITVPLNSAVAFPIGATVSITNLAATAITISSSATLRQAGTANTGNRTLAAYGMATLRKVATDTWFISGAGLS